MRWCARIQSIAALDEVLKGQPHEHCIPAQICYKEVALVLRESSEPNAPCCINEADESSVLPARQGIAQYGCIGMQAMPQSPDCFVALDALGARREPDPPDLAKHRYDVGDALKKPLSAVRLTLTPPQSIGMIPFVAETLVGRSALILQPPVRLSPVIRPDLVIVLAVGPGNPHRHDESDNCH